MLRYVVCFVQVKGHIMPNDAHARQGWIVVYDEYMKQTSMSSFPNVSIAFWSVLSFQAETGSVTFPNDIFGALNTRIVWTLGVNIANTRHFEMKT